MGLVKQAQLEEQAREERERKAEAKGYCDRCGEPMIPKSGLCADCWEEYDRLMAKDD